MRDRVEPGGYTAPYVEDRFERAGRVLMALPWIGCYPAGLTCFWPEISGDVPRRWAVPPQYEITRMAETYDWVRLIADPDPARLIMIRRLVLMRSLVKPDSPQEEPDYKFSWRKLVRMTGLHRDTLITRWGEGIDRIVGRLNHPGLCARSGGRIGPDAAAVRRWLSVREIA
jgi:hypothetical protein